MTSLRQRVAKELAGLWGWDRLPTMPQPYGVAMMCKVYWLGQADKVLAVINEFEKGERQ